ncbi:MAG: monovalent cation/H+ antiporter subunit D family protein [Candidatus Thermoplasmatota archaeon]|nr:monovalent cation/H+ antiporter subunit D family protein [Candidatus Thermoplasmatota archaeon]
MRNVVGGWSRISGIEVGIDSLNFFFLMATFIIFPMVAFYSFGYFEKSDNKESRGVSRESKFCLMLLLYGSLIGTFITRDLFNFTVYLEIASLAAIILVGSSDTSGAKVASFRYLMLYLLSSFFFIFSVGLIYAKTGYLNFPLIEQNLVMDTEMKVAISIAFIALIMKAGIFPLHFWLPDAHSKADTPVSALLSGLSVKAPVFGMLLFLKYTSIEFLVLPLMILAFSSIFFGIGMALYQSEAKKLLAYSTVSQMGFVLLCVSTLNIIVTGVYVLAHALAKAALFLGIGIIIKEQDQKDLDSLYYSNRKILMTTMILLSLAIGGVSPFLGGYAKKLLSDILAKEIVFLFYIASIGTLTLMARLNYELLTGSSEKKQRFNLKVILPFALATASLGFGIYYKPNFSFLGLALIGIAIATFFILKYSRILDRDVLSHLKRHEKGLPVEINFYTMIFVLLNILFIFLVLYHDVLRETITSLGL